MTNFSQLARSCTGVANFEEAIAFPLSSTRPKYEVLHMPYSRDLPLPRSKHWR